MILKLDERAARVRFEISSMILRPKLNDKKFNYRFITAVLKLIAEFSQYHCLVDLVANLLKSETKGLFSTSHFVFVTEMM